MKKSGKRYLIVVTLVLFGCADNSGWTLWPDYD